MNVQFGQINGDFAKQKYFLHNSNENTFHAAGFIDAFFEEKDPEAELLKLVLSDVAEALAEEKMTSERAKIHREKLDEILSQKGSDSIYI